MRKPPTPTTSAFLTHGKASTYNYHGCRCDKCKAAMAEVRRKEREKKNST